MRELLQRWSELEPGFCEESQINPGLWYIMDSSGKPAVEVDPDELDDIGSGQILMTVMAAIKTHDWEWQLSSNHTDDVSEPTIFYHAQICRPIGFGIEDVYGAVAPSAVEALLKVYLEALEAIGEVISVLEESS